MADKSFDLKKLKEKKKNEPAQNISRNEKGQIQKGSKPAFLDQPNPKRQAAQKFVHAYQRFMTPQMMENVIRKVYQIAMDDDHKKQLEALQMLQDRIMGKATQHTESYSEEHKTVHHRVEEIRRELNLPTQHSQDDVMEAEFTVRDE